MVPFTAQRVNVVQAKIRAARCIKKDRNGPGESCVVTEDKIVPIFSVWNGLCTSRPSTLIVNYELIKPLCLHVFCLLHLDIIQFAKSKRKLTINVQELFQYIKRDQSTLATK